MQLNQQQKEAVEFVDGPLMIIAGAGTGKTTVLTERVKKIINDDLAKPSEILALTFTEKAAREMEERIDVALPMGYVQTWILTFHKFSEQILRNEALAIGLNPSFDLLTEAETQLFIKKRFDLFNLSYFKPRGNPTKFLGGLAKHFSRLKDEDVSPKDYQRWITQQKPTDELPEEEIQKFKELADAYATYEQLKAEEGAMDFGDLIVNTLKLFKERPDVLKRYQEQFKYILVDEYQDTNFAQTEIVHLLASAHRKVAVFLDDDQSIYRFRGAAVYNAMSFREQFDDANIIVLTENYRSTQPILDRSHTLVAHNDPDRLEVKENISKKLNAAKGAGTEPRIMFTERGEDEADAVAREVKRLMDSKEIDQWKDVAILVRANNHADIFTRAFTRHGVPFQFLGPGKLYNQPEIKDLIAYFRILVNFNDDVSMYRLLTKDFFAINRRDIAALLTWANAHNWSLFEALEHLEHQENSMTFVEAETPEKLLGIRNILLDHLEKIPDVSPGQLLFYFLEDSKLLEMYSTVTTDRQQREVQNISRFFDQLRAFEIHQPDATVYDWVEYLEFVWDQGESPIASETDWSEVNAVNILTVHSAKGLEFPAVFLVNAVNGRFPSQNRSDKIPIPDALAKEPSPERDVHAQEERRLFYVAMTRAKDLLYITGAKFYGDAKRPKKLSPFVNEALGEDLTEFLYEQDNKDKTLPLFDWIDVRRDQNHEDTAPIQHKVTHLSYSRINAFQLCPLHYKLQYILNIPTAPGGALSLGTSVHNTMRAFFEMTRAQKKPVTDAEALSQTILELFDQFWIPVGYETKNEKNRNYEKGRSWLTNYVRQHYDPHEETVDLEKPFSIKIDKDLRLDGRIDRVSRLQDGTLEIIDYKTGKPKGQKALEKDLQLAVYAMAAVNSSVYSQPLNELSLAFFYFDSNEKIAIEITQDRLDQAREEILIIRDEIEASDFACSNNFVCQNRCEYDLFCNRGE